MKKANRIYIRVSEKEFQEIKKLADKYTRGNISAFLILKALGKI